MDIDKKLKIIYFIAMGLIIAIVVAQYSNVKMDIRDTLKSTVEKAAKKASEIPEILKIEKAKEEDLFEKITAETTQAFNEQEKSEESSSEDMQESQVERLLVLNNSVEFFLLENKTKQLETRAEQEQNFVFNEDKPKLKKWMALPKGFFFGTNSNFLFYRQQQEVDKKIKETADSVRKSLMKDLLPFAVIKDSEKVLMVLFGSPDFYSYYTNRPPWSAGCADIIRRTVYLVETPSMLPVATHELTHVYFDPFFAPQKSPLWLSEGMSLNIQNERFPQETSWLDNTLKSEYYRFESLENLFDITDLSAMDDGSAELWYAQSFSIVNYLRTLRTSNNFYNFCKNIKEGNDINQALFKAYGMPYSDVSALELVWQHKLKQEHEK